MKRAPARNVRAPPTEARVSCAVDFRWSVDYTGAMKHSPAFLKIVNEARSRVRECTVPDVKARMDRGEPLLLVDVREDNEVAAGRLPGARHIGKGIIERDIEVAVPDRAREIVLYCGGGFRSVLAAVSLQEMGYTNVLSMDGGFRGWTEAGFPLEGAKS